MFLEFSVLLTAFIAIFSFDPHNEPLGRFDRDQHYPHYTDQCIEAGEW